METIVVTYALFAFRKISKVFGEMGSYTYIKQRAFILIKQYLCQKFRL